MLLTKRRLSETLMVAFISGVLFAQCKFFFSLKGVYTSIQLPSISSESTVSDLLGYPLDAV